MTDSRLTQLLQELIDAWCARRELRPLAILLPSYLAFTGLADSTADLYQALTDLRGLPPELLPDTERAAIAEVRALLWSSLKAAGARVEEIDRAV